MSSNQSHRYISKAHLTHSRVGFYFKNMFGALKRKAEKFKALNQDEMLTEILNDDVLQAQIVDLNRKQLYEQGVQADGSETGQYAPITISHYKPIAASQGRDGRTDHITLKDTGAFYDSMKVKSLPDGIVIGADDPNNLKTKEPQMLGLTIDSIREILPEIRESLRESIIKKTT